ncbi:hypothetical protein [Streptomyces sp. NPDC005181]|uniref:hypothetical protein n=1 Tax=Streptomyces sp. NPDC005181 TaxID=3156869 RepID=UPI0033AEAA9B
MPGPRGRIIQRADVGAGIASADVVVDAGDTTGDPLGPPATVAPWDGNSLMVHAAAQWLSEDVGHAVPVGAAAGDVAWDLRPVAPGRMAVTPVVLGMAADPWPRCGPGLSGL